MAPGGDQQTTVLPEGQSRAGEVPDVEIENCSFAFNSVPVLRDVNIRIYHGDFVAIIGPNGGGKTTLVKLMLGLLKPQKGRVRLLGSDPAKSCRRVGYMPQYSTGEKGFPITVMDVALLGRLGLTGIGCRFTREDREAALGALRLVGMEKYMNKRIGDLSGGQIQRTLLARALISNPEVLFLDEPMASIDIDGQSMLFDLLGELNKKMTILFVTHDVGLLSRYIKSIICVNETVYFHHEPKISPDMASLMMGTGEKCPVEMVAHGIPHRVLGRHERD
ncbi:MAG: ABC transporter [Thermodesulfatator sp.]|nr:MAG: ABC transporter [Thermodesulfatator sp.]